MILLLTTGESLRNLVLFSHSRSLIPQADLYAKQLKTEQRQKNTFVMYTPSGNTGITLSIPGKHNCYNALAASAAGIALNLSLSTIKTGLEQATAFTQRSQLKQGIHDVWILDDSYNANPASMKASLTLLSEQPTQTNIAILGDMAELGDLTPSLHREVGEFGSTLPIDAIWSFGNHSQLISDAFSRGSRHFSSPEKLLDALAPYLNQNTTLLIKGSFSMNMARFVKALEQTTGVLTV